MAYHFNTSSAENEEKISVERRLESAEKVIDDLGLINEGRDSIELGNFKDADFNKHFRHSEQALFEYLKTKDYISYLMGLMLENKVVKL